MKWRTRLLFHTALGTLLAATNCLASTPPMGSAARPLQFTSLGHIVGFTSNGLYVATGSQALHIEFIGAQNVTPIADGSTANNDKAAPLTRVTYPGIWGGVTLAYDAPGVLLRSTYILAPGADPAKIRLRYNAPVAVGPAGELRIGFATGAMRESAPVAWQDIEGRRVLVAVGFHQESEREVGFALGPYDKARPLTIDPTLSWNTFLGGTGGDVGSGIAVDASGNVYVAGYSEGTWGTQQRPWAGYTDTFVAKFDANGALLWNTFLGGAGYDRGYGIAVDTSGNVYVTGYSESTWGTPKRALAGNYDAFVAKLDTNGALLWNTFLGWTGYDHGYGIAVDTSGNAYVTGYSEGTWGDPKRPWVGNYDAFVAKLDTSGTLLWNTFLGGGGDKGYGIVVDASASANVYVTGYSESTWGAPKRLWTGNYDAFVAKLDTTGVLLWNTFLGGASEDAGSGIAVNASGNVYVTGFSNGTWGAPNRAFTEGDSDAFAAKLDTNGVLQWNTFLGGSDGDVGAGIVVNASGNVYVTGNSSSAWGSPIWVFMGGNSDAFVASLDAYGALLRNNFLGGTFEDRGSGIATDVSGNAYVTGPSYSTWGGPILPFAGSNDAFVALITNDIMVPPSYVLWTNGSAGQAIRWKVDPATAAMTGWGWISAPSGVGAGWQASSYTQGATTDYVLWTNSRTGQAIRWKVDPITAAMTDWVWISPTTGVGAGWQASSYARGDATTDYVLWTNGTTGQAIRWKIDPVTGAMTGWGWISPATGVGAGWEATSYARGDATTDYVLWANGSTGQAIRWKINPVTGAMTGWGWISPSTGVGAGWQASSYAREVDYVLWTNSGRGQAIRWKVDPITGAMTGWEWISPTTGVGGGWQISSY